MVDLLKAGAPPNIQHRAAGATALMRAAYMGHETPQPRSLFKKAGAVEPTSQTKNGETAPVQALRQFSQKLLLQSKAPPGAAISQGGWTLFLVALSSSPPDPCNVRVGTGDCR
jgi:hypothetical protein